MRFFYRIGFVLGWTLLVAYFTSSYGIFSLPILFIFNALFSIVGSFLYFKLLDKVKKPFLMMLTLALAALVLFVSSFLALNENVVFFAFLLLAEAIFLVQFKILLDGYIEEMFTPLSSERTFPVIESAETIGGILGGVLIVFLANYFALYQFIYLWIFFVVLTIPIIFLFEALNPVVVKAKACDVECKASLFSRLKGEFVNAKNVSFVRNLFFIVLIQWVLYSLLEFQYTRVVYQNTSSVLMDTGSGFEHAFVHDLGLLFAIFSSSALIIQLFVGSRLIKSLGIIATMLLHPIVTFLSVLGLTFSYTFPVAVLAKNNFTMTTALYTNAYHSAYYAVKTKFREHTRQFLEGMIRPLGALLGTFLLLLLQLAFSNHGYLFFAINVLMLLFSAGLYFIVRRQQVNYTQLALNDLKFSKDRKLKANALDILAQKGHKNTLETLHATVLNKKMNLSLRVKTLRALSELAQPASIAVILKVFLEKNIVLREACIDTLFHFDCISRKNQNYPSYKFNVFQTLKSAFNSEKDEYLRNRMIDLISYMSEEFSIEFLLTLLKSTNLKIRSAAVLALGGFGDQVVVAKLSSLLRSKSDRIRVYSAIALHKFPEYKELCEHILSEHVLSTDLEKNCLAAFAFGELKLKKGVKFCMDCMRSSDLDLKIHGALALSKMGIHDSVPVLVDLLFSDDIAVSKRSKRFLKSCDLEIIRDVERIIRNVATNVISQYAGKSGKIDLESLDDAKIKKLKWMYALLDEYEEVEYIDKKLNK
ncbi:HEAT repeat domain-containing protein [Patescibacteria group bacterium]|nr:HEAT repeat domain-containing protein [Patescibacteria group bacterium]